jgi:hypothetical protein
LKTIFFHAESAGSEEEAESIEWSAAAVGTSTKDLAAIRKSSRLARRKRGIHHRRRVVLKVESAEIIRFLCVSVPLR